MPVSSAETFLQLVEKSSLLSPEQIKKVRGQYKDDGDAKAVARGLVQDGKLTKWQALQLLSGRHALAIGEYILLDQTESRGTERVFLAKHSTTGRQGILKTIPRKQVTEDPDAAQQFVNQLRQQAEAEDLEILDVHRPDKDDQRCYVVLAKSRSSADAAPGEPAPAKSAPASPAKSEGDASPARGPVIRVGPDGGGKAGVETAATAVGGIAIDTGPKRRRKKKGKATRGKAAPAAATAAATTAASSEAGESATKVASPKSPVALIVAGAVGAGCLLVTGLVLTVIFFLSRGDDDTVALAETGNDAVEQAVDGDPDTDESDPDTGAADPESDPEIDPVISVPSNPEPAPESDPVIPTIDDTNPGPDNETTPADSSTPDVAIPDASPAEPERNDVTTASEPSAKPTDVPGPELTADENPADPANPGVDPDTGTETPAEAPAAPKKVPAEPPVKKKAPMPAKKPFADLAATVALPDLEATGAGEPKALGSVYIPEDELCFVKLRGGENASKGTPSISMRNADGGLAERDWEISVCETAGGAETKIAHLSVNDQHQLTFAWQPQAETQPIAAYLKNCAFSFSCAGESHVTTLREPSQGEPLTVDFAKSMTKEDWPIELCPDPKEVKIEITDVQGAKFTVEPSPVMGATNSEAWLRIEDGGNMLSLKLEASMRRNLQLEVSPYIKPSPDMQPQKFNPRMLQTYIAQATQKQTYAANMVQQFQQALKQRNIPDQQKKREIQPRLAMFEQEHTAAQAAVQSLQELDQLVKKLSENMQIKFRVFYNADSSQVELLRAGA
jgi:hypothetical protein